MYTPPPRAKENQEILWNAVRTNVLQAISTDHCAYLFDGQKDAWQGDFAAYSERRPGPREPAADDPHFGVRERRSRSTGWSSCSAPTRRSCSGSTRARARGRRLRRRLVVFDPDKRVTISAATHHSRSDYNLYEGTEGGLPEIVLLRGDVIVDGDGLLAKPGSGQFIKRARPNKS